MHISNIFYVLFNKLLKIFNYACIVEGMGMYTPTHIMFNNLFKSDDDSIRYSNMYNVQFNRLGNDDKLTIRRMLYG